MLPLSPPSSFSRRTLFIGLFFGVLCTFLLNLPSFLAIKNGYFSLETLGIQAGGSPDETYYAALIRDIADGNLTLGNVSSFEHRFAQSVVGYAPLLQGFLMKFFHWSILTTIFVGDIFFPILAACITYFLVRRSESDGFAAFFGALAMMAWKGGGWLRTISPEMTGVLFLTAVLTFYSEGQRSVLVRGILIGLLLLVQPIYAAFLLIAEGLLFCVSWKQKGFRFAIMMHAPCIAIVVAVIVFRLFLAVQDPDPLALADTYRRLGIIPSHLPTVPLVQLLIIGALILHQITVWRMVTQSRVDRVILPLLLVTSLFSLWLSFPLGVDGNFGLYLTFPIQCILWLTFFRSIHLVFPRWLRIILFFVLSIFCVVLALERMPIFHENSSQPTAQVIQELLSFIATEEPIRIIAAPIELSNFVPVLTSHFTLFTQYAHFQYARDQELAERYVTLKTLFPMDPIYTVEGDPLVFGLYAGNLSARERTWCRIVRSLGFSKAPCTQRLNDFIYHQDVRKFIETGTVSVIDMLKKYGVNTIISAKALPASLQRFCTVYKFSTPYTIYDCDFLG